MSSAAALVAREDDYLQPELTADLKAYIGNNTSKWTQILANMMLTYGDRPLNVSEVQAGKTELDRPRFKGFALAQLALSHVPAAKAETLIWRTLLNDLPGFMDEPYHSLFQYNSTEVSHFAVGHLSQYRNDSAFLAGVRQALQEDRPGSSFLAEWLIRKGQQGCLSAALDRALKVVQRPASSSGDDVASAVHTLTSYGTKDQRQQLSVIASRFQEENPDYAAYLQRALLH